MNTDKKRLVWLMEHCYFPHFMNQDGKGYGFGTLPRRKTIRQAVDDAIKCEKGSLAKR